MEFPTKSEFWDYTLAIYGKQGFSPAVIALQDKLKLDVDILIFCCWTASTGRGPLNAATVAKAREVADPWQAEVVNALRIIRRRIKEGFKGTPEGLPAGLGKDILGREIDAERIEQMMLEAIAPAVTNAGKSAGDKAKDAADSLDAYLKACNIKADDADRGHLATVLASAFPEVDADKARTLLS
ncbi:MAG: TIGR02444 family protein [Alphaproteobacteria bacterium]|nr:TIGR02444 family protein [Alphaproteobacteria bacterium]